MSDSPRSFYIIVYPSGDRRRLTVAEILYSLDYEVKDYALASEQRFHGDTAERDALVYARELARKHKLTLTNDEEDLPLLDGELAPEPAAAEDVRRIFQDFIDHYRRGGEIRLTSESVAHDLENKLMPQILQAALGIETER